MNNSDFHVECLRLVWSTNTRGQTPQVAARNQYEYYYVVFLLWTVDCGDWRQAKQVTGSAKKTRMNGMSYFCFTFLPPIISLEVLFSIFLYYWRYWCTNISSTSSSPICIFSLNLNIACIPPQRTAPHSLFSFHSWSFADRDENIKCCWTVLDWLERCLSLTPPLHWSTSNSSASRCKRRTYLWTTVWCSCAPKIPPKHRPPRDLVFYCDMCDLYNKWGEWWDAICHLDAVNSE